MEVEAVLEKAKAAKAAGAERFCMGAAWRSPHERDMPYVLAMVEGVKAMGLETCMTLGMLDAEKSRQLAAQVPAAARATRCTPGRRGRGRRRA